MSGNVTADITNTITRFWTAPCWEASEDDLDARSWQFHLTEKIQGYCNYVAKNVQVDMYEHFSLMQQREKLEKEFLN